MQRLAANQFRAKFSLQGKDLLYLQEKGTATVLEHGRDFLKKRLAPAHPVNDGKQTPWRGHPIFVSQHATGTCCRSCLRKWHQIDEECELTEAQLDYILSVLERWLSRFTL